MRCPSKYFSPLLIAVIVTLAFSAKTSSASDQPKRMPLEGIELIYVDQGEGVPVLFVHGAISDLRVWDQYRATISEERRFVAYTQRYFGDEPWSDDGELFSDQTHANDLIAFIEALDAGPVHLVTWSYSGSIGTLAALERPDLFRSMTHYEPVIDSLIADIPGAKSATLKSRQPFGPAVASLKEGDLEGATEGFLEAVWELPEGDFDKLDQTWQDIFIDQARTVPVFLKRRTPPTVTCDQLMELKIPALLVQGQNTYTRFSMITEAMQHCIPDAQLLTIEGANHGGPMRHADTMKSAMLEFFDKAE